jgi:hypothetical protein
VPGRALDRDHQLLDVEGLGDEVERAGADGRHRRLQRPERGDGDDRDVGAVLDHARAQLEPARPAHAQIGDDHVELLCGQALEGGVGARLGDRAEAARA